MNDELREALERMNAAWGKDQTKHHTEMFAAIGAVLRAYNDWKLMQPIPGSNKRGALKSGKYSTGV